MIHQQPATMKSHSPSLSEDAGEAQSAIHTCRNTESKLVYESGRLKVTYVCVSRHSPGIVFVYVRAGKTGTVGSSSGKGPELWSSTVTVISGPGPSCDHMFTCSLTLLRVYLITVTFGVLLCVPPQGYCCSCDTSTSSDGSPTI